MATVVSAHTAETPVKVVSSFDEIEKAGKFARKKAVYDNWITTDGSSEFPAEANRYHLYVSKACPWAHRCMIYRELKGLTDVISMSVVAPVWVKTRPDDDSDTHHGWGFDPSVPGATEDHLFGYSTLRDVYAKVAPLSPKPTTPLLLDTKTMKAVSNESADITVMFNERFNEFATNPELNLIPETLTESIKENNEWIYDHINNGVYKCGFAATQAAYDEAITPLFDALDRAEAILSESRYINGDIFTDTDIRLFVTLARFDEVYTVHFKCNKKMIREYPNLKGYVQDIYQMPKVSDTTDMFHIRQHYYRSHPLVNRYGTVPVGHGWEWFSEPHNRAEVGSRK